MKLNLFHFLFIFYFLKVNLTHRKFRKHGTNILDNTDNSSLKIDQIFNQTEHKLFNQLLHNFNENEQMSEIISIFKTIKAQVKNEDEKLNNFSSKVMAFNKEILNYFESNKIDFNDKNHMNIQMNTNISALKNSRENMTNLLIEIQGIIYFCKNK